MSGRGRPYWDGPLAETTPTTSGPILPSDELLLRSFDASRVRDHRQISRMLDDELGVPSRPSIQELLEAARVAVPDLIEAGEAAATMVAADGEVAS
ncbi:hypothetical protein GCM10027053_46380 [Intrasporangium mesophilum]